METESVVKLEYTPIHREEIMEDIEKATDYYIKHIVPTPPQGSFTIDQLAEKIGKGYEVTREALVKMQKNGVVKRVGRFDNKHYYQWVGDSRYGGG